MPDPLGLIRQVERPTVTFPVRAPALLPMAAMSPIARIGRHCEEPQGDEAML
jgi:hypothetical protein